MAAREFLPWVLRMSSCWTRLFSEAMDDDEYSVSDGLDFRVIDPATITMNPTFARTLTKNWPVCSTFSPVLHYGGRTGDLVVVALSSQPVTGFSLSGLLGSSHWHLGGPLLKVRSRTRIARVVDGEVDYTFGPIDLAAGGRSFHAQALYINGAERGVSSPTQFHLVGD